MTRLALAKTLVSGTVTLQGNTFTFTASGSGTATADRVPEAKKLAVAASNTAATVAARASIDKILAENSSVLSDLEITSLISNNLSTTVVAFKPIALASIASSTDGVNYTLNPNVTIGQNQWLTVPTGKTLYGAPGNPFTNNGYLELGDTTQKSSSALKSSDCCTLISCSTFPLTNNGNFTIKTGTCYAVTVSDICTNSKSITINSGGCLTINTGGALTNSESESAIFNSGCLTISTGGALTNFGSESAIFNEQGGTFTNSGTITNSGDRSSVSNQGTFTNNSDGTITNGDSSSVGNQGTFTNSGTITNGGDSSSVSNQGTFNNEAEATITNSGDKSSVGNQGTFNNSGTITNSGSRSSTNSQCPAIWIDSSGSSCTGSCNIETDC